MKEINSIPKFVKKLKSQIKGMTLSETTIRKYIKIVKGEL